MGSGYCAWPRYTLSLMCLNGFGKPQRRIRPMNEHGFGPIGAQGHIGPVGDTGYLNPFTQRQQLRTSLLDGMTSAQRKEYPITTGCLDYFRDALLLVSHVSYKGNQKHNPGEPLHWARAKSADEEDAIGRHLVNRYEMDTEIGLEEAAQLAWRALAFLQKLAEKKHNIKPPIGCK